MSGRKGNVMRIITGSARGRKLAAPEGLDVRPTTEITKEAVFSSIQFVVAGAHFLDLFAGTGQMGLEAISRGAQSATFVENGRSSLQALRQNIEHCGFSQQSRVYAMDVQSFLNSTQEQYDIVFLDPPYLAGTAAKILPLVAEHTKPDGIILCETDKNEVLPEQVGNFVLKKSRKYSKTIVYTYEAQNHDQEE